MQFIGARARQGLAAGWLLGGGGVRIAMMNVGKVPAAGGNGGGGQNNNQGGQGGAGAGNAPNNLPRVRKAVNSDIAHAADQAVARNVFPDRRSAADALRELSRKITADGAFPRGTIPDPRRADSVLVPFGNGHAVYEVKNNGTAILRTVLGGGG